MRKKDCYSPEEIERLKKLPGIMSVTSKMVIFDVDFKQAIYDEWVVNQSAETIWNSFITRGAQLQKSDYKMLKHLHRGFHIYGRPKQQMRLHGSLNAVHKTQDDLINERVLYRTPKGVRLTENYRLFLKSW